jgi:hypothetical protein
MRHTLDDLKPEERRHAVAAILAKGLLRLRSSTVNRPDSKPPESGQGPLDVSATPSPHATNG